MFSLFYFLFFSPSVSHPQLTAASDQNNELEAKITAISGEFERTVAKNKKLETDLLEVPELKKVCVCVCLSVCASVSVCLCVCLFVLVCLFVCLCLSVCLSVFVSLCVSFAHC